MHTHSQAQEEMDISDSMCGNERTHGLNTKSVNNLLHLYSFYRLIQVG